MPSLFTQKSRNSKANENYLKTRLTSEEYWRLAGMKKYIKRPGCWYPHYLLKPHSINSISWRRIYVGHRVGKMNRVKQAAKITNIINYTPWDATSNLLLKPSIRIYEDPGLLPAPQNVRPAKVIITDNNWK